jgi:hypothetical protein
MEDAITMLDRVEELSNIKEEGEKEKREFFGVEGRAK